MSYKDIIKSSVVKPREGTEEERRSIHLSNHRERLVFYTYSQILEHNRIRREVKKSKATLSLDDYIKLLPNLREEAEKHGLIHVSLEDFEREMLTQQSHKEALSTKETRDLLDTITNSIPLIDLVRKYITPRGWEKVFEDAQDDLNIASQYVQELRKVFRIVPDNKDVFRAFYYTPLDKVRVVIVGQDPYPKCAAGKPVACGLSFSTRAGIPIQGSAKNIYANLKRTFPFYNIPHHADFTYWARQGVLMLNASLTCTEGKPGSHAGRWNGFLKRVIEAILNNSKNTIFVLWGKDAEKIQDNFLGGKGIVVVGPHPSPMNAANREKFISTPFFLQINEILKSLGSTPIDWVIPLDAEEGYTKEPHAVGTIGEVIFDFPTPTS